MWDSSLHVTKKFYQRRIVMKNPKQQGKLWMAVAVSAVAILLIALATQAQAQTFTVLHNFTGGGDGSAPYAGLSMDRAGNLYGTTSAGNSSVFRMSNSGSSWILTSLYTFKGGSDGAVPYSRVIIGPDGSLYGTTTVGGTGCSPNGCGTVYRLRPPASACKTALCPWTKTALYRFTGSTDGSSPSIGDLLLDQAGNLYGTTTAGGADGQGVVFKLTPSGGGWTESVLWSFTGGSDGSDPQSGVIFDDAGNLYGTTYIAGKGGEGTVYQLSPSGSGWTENTLYSFTGGNDGSNPIGGVAMDAQGNLYGTTVFGGSSGGGTVYELTPSNGTWTFTLLQGFTGYEGPYDTPTLDAEGNVLGTSSFTGGNGQVFKLTPSNGGWTYNVLHNFTGNDGYVPAGNVILDSNGILYGTTLDGGADGKGVVFEITP
jgi:uncharacterized repeat protein (TIGR03803 family)